MYHSEMEQVFLSRYRVVAATTPDLLNEVYRVRYQIYCQKLKYEDASRFPNGLEVDQHDRHSVHCLLQERQTGRFVGCVRMILANACDPQRKLPFEEVYDRYTDTDSEPMLATGLPWVDRDTLAEVSRLAVLYPDTPGGSPLRTSNREVSQRMAFIGFGLYLAAVGIVIDRGLDNVFAMMEPQLTRLLKRYGILFEQVGDTINYRGRRAAFHVTRDSLIENLSPEMCKLLGLIMQEMRRHPDHWDARRPGFWDKVEPEGWWSSSKIPQLQAVVS